MIIIIKNHSSLKETIPLVLWLNRPHVDNVLISLSWLNKSEQDRLAKLLKNLFNDCGCFWGNLVFLFTFIPYLYTQLHISGFSWGTLGYSFLIGVSAAFLGKLLGLGWSYWRLKVWFQWMVSKDNRKALGKEESCCNKCL